MDTQLPPDDTPLTESERGAVRSYVQRAEVRISTQHRIATAFIGGAGLLLLIPIFLRDIVDGILISVLGQFGNLFPALGAPWDVIVSVLLLACIGYVFALSLFIPLYGVYLLLKDLVHFYYTLYAPGFSSDLLNPTLALGGINFSPDESPRVKQRIFDFQYVRSHMDFMMPFSKGRREKYFDALIAETDGAVLPSSRDLAALKASGALHTSEDDARHFNAALGLARAIDRTLVEEAAFSEMQIARNTLYLRRLLLRYVKTMLMFIWTTVVSFLLLPFLHDARFPNLLVLALAYTVWSGAVMVIVRLPVNWIYRHRYDDPTPRHLDAQLTLLEDRVYPATIAAVAASLLAVALALISMAAG
jgi:hypothetical protein